MTYYSFKSFYTQKYVMERERERDEGEFPYLSKVLP